MPGPPNVWDHFYKSQEKFSGKDTHYKTWCKYCIDERVRRIRSNELNAESTGTLVGWARTEDQIRNELFESVKPKSGKSDRLWKYLADKCPNAPGHAKATATQEVLAQEIRRVNKKKEDVRDRQAALQTMSSASTPGPSRTQPMALGDHSRTASTSSSFASTSDAALQDRPSKRQRVVYEPEPETVEAAPSRPPWTAAMQAEFAAGMCRLMLMCNIAWWASEHPFWRAFFKKWIPEAHMPGRRELSGCILDEEAHKVLEGMKPAVRGKVATGQCDGWKSNTKTSLIASMMNVEYKPYLLNTVNVTTLPKTAETLLDIVLKELTYCWTVLHLIVVAWCTDASGESAKMRRLLVRKYPFLVVVDCWCHQVDLVVGDIFKAKGIFIEVVNEVLEVVKWFNNHSRALGFLKEVTFQKLKCMLCLILPVLTRWTSHYLCVRRMLELQKPFRQLLIDFKEELLLCGGKTREAKDAANKVVKMLASESFWPRLEMVEKHLEPLAVAANTTQTDHARLDVVLLTLANLFRIYSSPDMDQAICAAVRASLEKRWAKADRPIFILAVVFNLYVRTSCFCNPYSTFGQLWPLVRAAFKRFYDIEPDTELRREFQEYIKRIGTWSDAAMDLADRKRLAKSQNKPVNLIDLWREYEPVTEEPTYLQVDEPDSDNSPPPPPLNGEGGLARLAMRILSIVPNSAATERTFSQFGVVLTSRRNRLHPTKVRKMVMIRVDTAARFGLPPRHKRKFGAADRGDPDNFDNDDDNSSFEPIAAAPLSTPASGPEASGSSSTPPSDGQLDSPVPQVPAVDFTAVARDLIQETEQQAHDTEESEDLPSDEDPLLLANLFIYPTGSEASSRISMSILTDFWFASKQGLDHEVEFQDAVYEEGLNDLASENPTAT